MVGEVDEDVVPEEGVVGEAVEEEESWVGFGGRGWNWGGVVGVM